MDDTKHPLKSLGIVGPMGALVVLLANHVWPGLGLSSDGVASGIDAADALLGCVLGIVGRWRATQRISLGMLALLCVMAGTGLTACSVQQLADAGAQSDSAVAQAQPTIELACWLATAADAGFQAYASSTHAAAAMLADESRAMAAVSAICAAPPINTGQAVAAVLQAYKAIVATTPAAADGA
jgi:hypothetical protein